MSQEPCKVLVVDDERTNADSVVRLLQVWAHEAEAACSAEDAISKAVAFDPDVVLIDIGFSPSQPLPTFSSTRRDRVRYCFQISRAKPPAHCRAPMAVTSLVIRPESLKRR